MSYDLHDLAGNVGVATILLSYLLVQLGRVDARGLRYSLLNAVGASLILLSLTVDFNLSAFIVELAWAIISLIGVARGIHARALSSSPPTR